MAQLNIKVQAERIEAKVKIVEEKKDGEVIDRHLITEVKLEYEGTPAKIDEVLYALRSGHPVDVVFGSPQLTLAGAAEEHGM